MSEIMVVGDLHVTHESLPAVRKLFNPNIIKNRNIIFLGDLFHSLERRIDAVLLLEMQKCFGTLEDNSSVAIMGNHDMLHGNYSKISLLPKITPILEPVVTKINSEITFVYLPWMKPEEFEALDTVFLNLLKTPGTIVFSHLPLYNSEFAKFGKAISLEYFRGASLVFNGHWHKAELAVVGETPIYNVGSYVPMSSTEAKTYMPTFPTFTVHETLRDTLNSVRLNNNGEILTPVHIHSTTTFDSAYNRADCIVILTTEDPSIAKQYDKVMKLITPKAEKMQLAIEASEKVKSLDKTQLITSLVNQYIESPELEENVSTMLQLLVPKEFGGQGTTEKALNDMLSSILSEHEAEMNKIFNRELNTND